MKIGFLGNANNSPFILARALRRLGLEVLFVLMFDNNWPLDRPEQRYLDVGPPYPDWICDASVLNLWDHTADVPQIDRVVQTLRECDAVVLNGYGICLAQRIDRPTIAFLTGTDLLTLAKYSKADEMINWGWDHGSIVGPVQVELFYLKRIYQQRFGIRNAVAVVYLPEGMNKEGDAILRGMGVDPSRRVYFQMTDLDILEYEPPPRNEKARFFCATRLTWDKSKLPRYSEMDYKSSDIMIRGVGLFARRGYPFELHLVRKGAHLSETVALVESEGLSSAVIWHDEMTQLEVFDQYRRADLVFEQFNPSGTVGMCGIDAMAIGRPVVANGRLEFFEKAFGEPPPICQAVTPEEVAVHLKRLQPNQGEAERIGMLSRRYVERHFSADKAAETIVERLESYLMDRNAQTESREAKSFQKTLSRELEFCGNLVAIVLEAERRTDEIESRAKEPENAVAHILAVPVTTLFRKGTRKLMRLLVSLGKRRKDLA